jgi:glycosyltransferase involved in cell wall biosynthesis
VREVARRLAGLGFDATVLTVDLAGSLPAAEEIDGVPVRRVPGYPRRRDYYIAPDVYRSVSTGGWDLVHCQGVHTFVPILAMRAAVRRRVPFVVTFHTGGHSSALRRLLRPAHWLALAPLLRRAARLIAVSEFEKRLFAGVPGIPRERLVVIPNGADLPALAGPAPPVEEGLIVSLGRLEKYKGHHLAIAALPALLDRIPSARLLIVGTGPYREDLEQLAARIGVSERVRITSIDSSDRAGMAALLSRAAAVVLLSEYEAHAIAAIEAIALDRPVVVTDATGLHDLVEAGLARGVRPGAGPSEISAAIGDEIASPRIRATRIPSWDDAATALATVYREAIATRRPNEP